jgi:hypothetical protein
VKVFNITDAPTSGLDAQGLSNQHLKIGDTVIPKGGSAVIKGTAREQAELQVFIKARAVTIDELPPAYAARRGLNVDGTPIAPPAEVEEVDVEEEPEPAPSSETEEEEF